MKINSIIDLVKDLDTSRQTKNLNKLLIRILLHLQVEFSIAYVEATGNSNNDADMVIQLKDKNVNALKQIVNFIKGFAGI